MPRPTFEGLPNELLTLVLSSISCRSDLTSLTHASPQCLRTYRASEGAILSTIVRRRIHPDVLPVAAAACDARTAVDALKLDGILPQNLAAAATQSLERFFDDHTSERIKHKLKPQNVAIWTQLLALCEVVDFFVERYAAQALGRLRSLLLPGTNPVDPNSPALSPVELGRLQRAFMRIEIYRRVFGGSKLHFGERAAASNARTRFALEFLPPWEREEFTSVYLYLAQTVFDAIGATERHLFTKIRAQAQQEHGDEPLPLFPNEEQRRSQRNGLKDLDEYGLAFYTESQACNHFPLAHRLMELGLPFFKHLLEQDLDRQIVLLRSFSGASSTSGRRSFGMCFHQQLMLRTYDWVVAGNRYPKKPLDLSFKDTPSTPNAGWLWAMHVDSLNFFDSREWRDPCAMGLSGHLFWDRERLEDLGFPQYAVFKPDQDYYSRWMQPTVEHRYRQLKPSLEERCKGLFVSKPGMQSIQPGWVLSQDRPTLLAKLEY